MASGVGRKMTTRKVIKKGDDFICGLCGQKYVSKGVAKACLKRCFEASQKEAGVATNVTKKVTKFRCSFCKRVYTNKGEAEDCVERCKHIARLKHKREQDMEKSLDQNKEEKAKQLAKIAEYAHMEAAKRSSDIGNLITQRGNSFICNACKSTYSNEKDAASCAARHQRGRDSTSYTDRVAKAKKAAAEKRQGLARQLTAKENRKIKKPDSIFSKSGAGIADSKMYKKEGDRFVCQTCGIAYEERSLVVSCYQKHHGGSQNLSAKKKIDPDFTIDDDQGKSKDELAREKAQSIGDVADKEKFTREGAKYICRACNDAHFTKMEVVACFNGHLADSDENDLLTPDTDGSPESIDSEPKSKYTLADDADLPDKAKFTREGAKYVCKKCSRKHYMKIEVIECFNYDCPEVLPSQSDED
mgnify:CR=1 FL=1